ncbi:OsmC family protein [Flavobacterium sp. 83]|jgi:organic hydroperoxide reductase OsmC/OhrA|uniref:OsmC family protein n=1 Tax=Flavobacterium sp. 83 TaxID=1131812 RepID=UPI00068C31EA|nr:OsmC family protein [Flavobacterium sp. 83]
MHQYEVNLKWIGNRKGVLSSPIIPKNIEVAIPIDFPKGMEEILSFELLFLSSINSSLMSTFLAIAKNTNLKFISFESNSTCNVETINSKHTITEIVLKPKVVIPFFQKPEQVKHILKISEKSCAIANDTKTIIRLEPEVTVALTLISKEEKYDFHQQ